MTEPSAAVPDAVMSPLETCEPAADDADLGVFAGIVGEARVWCFGEATHGAHEFLALRNRLFAFAVERLGFTAIAVETHHGDAAIVDDYVLGRGELTAEVAQAVFSANAAFRWADAPFAENVQLVRWIRAYNDRPTTRRPIRFYGIDAGWSSAAPPEWDGSAEEAAALDFIGSIDRALSDRLGAAAAPYLERFNSDEIDTLAPTDRAALSEAASGILGAFDTWTPAWKERTAVIELQRARRHAEVALLLAHVQAEAGAAPPREGAPRGTRDAAMADGVRWILKREGDDGRVFVFASDGHVRKAPWTYADPAWRAYPAMGERLHDVLGDRMVVVGSAFDRGAHAGEEGQIVSDTPADPESLSGALAGAGSPLFVTDLRSLSGRTDDDDPLARWAPMRSATGADEPRLRAVDDFDALVYVDEISPIWPAIEWAP